MRLTGFQGDQFKEFENLDAPSTKLGYAVYSNLLVAQRFRNLAVETREFDSIRQ